LIFFDSKLQRSQYFYPKKASIGKRIVTKQLGANNYQPMEIIDEYKFKEGTEENKKAWAHAQKFVGHGKKFHFRVRVISLTLLRSDVFRRSYALVT